MFKPFSVALPRRSETVFDIRDFGAVPGGRVSNTAAFAAAVAAAAERGGKVVVPGGIWLTGPVQLRSGVELHLSDNAVMLFSKNREEYPLIVTDFEGIRRIRAVSPIWAENAEDIAITGHGVMHGNGQLWRPVKQFKMTQRQWDALLKRSEHVLDSREGGIWFPEKSIMDAQLAGEVFPDSCGTEAEALEKAAPEYDFYRPVMVSLRRCRRVLLEDVCLQDSPAWCVHPWFCEDLTVRGVFIQNPAWAQNGDGIDVESCKRVHIHHCTFQTGDDGICLKSGKDREARKLKGPCEDVLIHDCHVGQSHGGFVIGSEMSRGVRNVLVKDCTFIDSDVGVRFKSAMGRGGVVENIELEDIQMAHIKGEAVILTMDYVLNRLNCDDPVLESEDPEDVPEFRNITFRRCISCGAGKPVKVQPLSGHPESIHDIVFEECDLEGMPAN